jgi:glycosyltransferase involved in cell wall biosynthesis
MKLLIDGMPLHAGGGVQVAIALLEQLNAAELPYLAVLPEKLRVALPNSLDGTCEERRIRLLPKNSRVDLLRAGARLRRIEQEFRPDVTFTVFGPAYFRASSPHLVGFALPNLIYPREGNFDGWRTKIADALRRRLFKRADHLVVETESAKRRLAELLGLSPDRISVVGNSVNPVLHDFTPTPISHDANAVLVPSTYYPHKNLEIVPRVAQALKALGGPCITFQLTLAPESAEWRAIAGQSESLGIGEMVTTLGVLRLDALAAAYRRARLVFLPTLREVSTAVYPEAFHFRRPLVTSDLDFARELCGDAAEFVPSREAQATAEILRSLLGDQRRTEALIEAGDRQLVTGYPTPEQKFASQMALLNRLAATVSRGSIGKENLGP